MLLNEPAPHLHLAPFAFGFLLCSPRTRSKLFLCFSQPSVAFTLFDCKTAHFSVFFLSLRLLLGFRLFHFRCSSFAPHRAFRSAPSYTPCTHPSPHARPLTQPSAPRFTHLCRSPTPTVQRVAPLTPRYRPLHPTLSFFLPRLPPFLHTPYVGAFSNSRRRHHNRLPSEQRETPFPPSFSFHRFNDALPSVPYSFCLRWVLPSPCFLKANAMHLSHFSSPIVPRNFHSYFAPKCFLVPAFPATPAEVVRPNDLHSFLFGEIFGVKLFPHFPHSLSEEPIAYP